MATLNQVWSRAPGLLRFTVIETASAFVAVGKFAAPWAVTGGRRSTVSFSGGVVLFANSPWCEPAVGTAGCELLMATTAALGDHGDSEAAGTKTDATRAGASPGGPAGSSPGTPSP